MAPAILLGHEIIISLMLLQLLLQTIKVSPIARRQHRLRGLGLSQKLAGGDQRAGLIYSDEKTVNINFSVEDFAILLEKFDKALRSRTSRENSHGPTTRT
jgi:hypothetical protein